MKIKEKLEILRHYFDSTRQVGHTTLLKDGTNNYNRDKLILTYKKEEHTFFNNKPSEIISWGNLNALRSHKKPLVVDNGVLWLMLNETIKYIDELEKYKENYEQVNKVIKSMLL